MIPIKTDKEIAILKQGGKRLAQVFLEVFQAVRPGISSQQLERLTDGLIKKQGGQASFKTVSGYRWTTCINVNDGVVHGIPGNYRFQEGDLVSLDMGMKYQGLHTDMARTFVVCSEQPVVNSQKKEFLQAGKLALAKATKMVRPGKRVGHLSQVIEKTIKQAGFQPVRTLTGHGVGRQLHEEPQIPCFLATPLVQTPLLRPGMVLAVEVIYTQGRPDLVLADDDWTLRTADGRWAGLFENSILITKDKPVILTKLKKSPTSGLNSTVLLK